MNILWISYFGSWTCPLAECLAKKHRITVLVPSNQCCRKTENGVEYIYFDYPEAEAFSMMTPEIFGRMAGYIKAVNPDIIHVHGTEKNLAQVQKFLPSIPVVTSIQGILMGYLPYVSNYLDMNKVRKFRTLKNLFGRGGALLMERCFRKGFLYENDILCNNKYFIGRTDFDKAHVIFRNPDAHYFVGEELLRDIFYHEGGSWSLEKCNRHSIFMPSGFNPIKGMHLAIEAVHLLKPFYPDIRLYIPGVIPSYGKEKRLLSKITGEEYVRYVFALVKQYQLEENVIFLPRQTAEQMSQHMRDAHVFLAPSSIDNSPNAVGEATMMGVPVVTTPVGGIPSFLRDGTDALLSPAGDSYLLAYNVKRIFDDDNFATMLSKNAYKVALRRHDREHICNQYLDSYQQIISIHKNNS